MQQFPLCWLAMRGVWVAVMVWCVGSGCAEPTLPLRQFLQTPDSRRERLQSALFSQDNEYARLRLSHYGLTSEGGWLRLPVFAPMTAVILANGAAGAREASLEPSLPLAGEDGAEENALRAAGRSDDVHFSIIPHNLFPDLIGFAKNPLWLVIMDFGLAPYRREISNLADS